MDMYQKREMRRQKKLQENNDEKKLTKVGINWDSHTLGKLLPNLYK